MPVEGDGSGVEYYHSSAVRTGTGSVLISAIRGHIDLAVLSSTGEADDTGIALCRTLFGDRFVKGGNLAAIAPSNVNPQNHMAIGLCNLTRMEKAEKWKQWANITHAVGFLMQGLDNERIAIAQAYGVTVRTLADHSRLSFASEGETIGEMAANLASRDNDPYAPATLESRWVLEDVPFGLWPTVCLRERSILPSRPCTSEILSIYGRIILSKYHE